MLTFLPFTLSRMYNYLILWDKFRVINRYKMVPLSRS